MMFLFSLKEILKVKSIFYYLFLIKKVRPIVADLLSKQKAATPIKCTFMI